MALEQDIRIAGAFRPDRRQRQPEIDRARAEIRNPGEAQQRHQHEAGIEHAMDRMAARALAPAAGQMRHEPGRHSLTKPARTAPRRRSCGRCRGRRPAARRRSASSARRCRTSSVPAQRPSANAAAPRASERRADTTGSVKCPPGSRDGIGGPNRHRHALARWVWVMKPPTALRSSAACRRDRLKPALRSRRYAARSRPCRRPCRPARRPAGHRRRSGRCWC